MWGFMIICYICMFFSFVFLSLSGLQMIFKFFIMNASFQSFSLFATTFYMFSQTLVMFYFIGSGTAIKKELNESKESVYLYDKVKKTKMILFPHLTVNIFLVGTAFVLIGAVDIGSVSSMVHNCLFFIAFAHFIYLLKVQHDGFKDNIDLLVDIADQRSIGKVIK